MYDHLATLAGGRTGRVSSWDTSGRNQDRWLLAPGETRVLADLEGPGVLTHFWFTQRNHYRECLLRITWDDAASPSVLVPLGDFFGLGHGIVNSYQSALFTASTNSNNHFNEGCALNSYVPIAVPEAGAGGVGQRERRGTPAVFLHRPRAAGPAARRGRLPARRVSAHQPVRGLGHEIRVNTPESNVVNREREAWDNNYVILDTRGRGHYLGCNLSVTNFQGTWWGEGDDMIWVDGYRWPPDLHGTGSEDYLNQAWGMQDNAFLRNGSSIFEHHTAGYQTSYVLHLENPVRFRKEVKVTIEHGHGNHLANEMASTAYWYAAEPTAAAAPPPVAARLPVLRDNQGRWLHDPARRHPGRAVPLNAEMNEMKARAARAEKA